MVARCSSLLTAQLTAQVLRIRQPVTTRPALNELEMHPPASPVRSFAAGKFEALGVRSQRRVRIRGRFHASLIATLRHAC